jgi:hypothetical protein
MSPYTGTVRMWAQFRLNVNLPSFQNSKLNPCSLVLSEEMGYGPPALRSSRDRHFCSQGVSLVLRKLESTAEGPP